MSEEKIRTSVLITKETAEKLRKVKRVIGIPISKQVEMYVQLYSKHLMEFYSKNIEEIE